MKEKSHWLKKKTWKKNQKTEITERKKKRKWTHAIQDAKKTEPKDVEKN